MPSENYDFVPWDSEDDIEKFLQLAPLAAKLGASKVGQAVASQGVKGALKTGAKNLRAKVGTGLKNLKAKVGVKGGGAVTEAAGAAEGATSAAKTAAKGASEAVESVAPKPKLGEKMPSAEVTTPEPPAAEPAAEMPEPEEPSGSAGKKTDYKKIGMQLAQQSQANAAQKKQAQEQRAMDMARRGASVQTGEPMEIAFQLLKEMAAHDADHPVELRSVGSSPYINEACTLCPNPNALISLRYTNPTFTKDYTHHLCYNCAEQYDVHDMIHPAALSPSDYDIKLAGNPMEIAYQLLKDSKVDVSGQHAAKNDPRFWEIMQHYGTQDTSKVGEPFLPYSRELADMTAQVDELLAHYGYEPYYFGGQYGNYSDLKNRNYTTGHLAIFDPHTEAASFGDAQFTDNWRKLHELGHAQGLEDLNHKWGEGRRLGKVGIRTPREMLRAVDWETMALMNQRKLMDEIGLPMTPQEYNRDWNTTVGDAGFRAITGQFTSPTEEGFVPYDERISPSYAMDAITRRAEELDIGMDEHLRDKKRLRRRGGARKVASEPMDIPYQLLKNDDRKNNYIEDAFDLGYPLLSYDELHDKQRAIVDTIADSPPSYWNDPVSGELETENYSGMFHPDKHHLYPEEAFDEYLRYIQHYHDASAKVSAMPHEEQMKLQSDFENPLHPSKVALDKMAEEYDHWNVEDPHGNFHRKYNQSAGFASRMAGGFGLNRGEPIEIAYQLLKANFNEYFGTKDSWVSLPKEGMDAKPELYGEVADAMNISYEAAGGHAKYKNADDLQEEQKHHRYDMIDNDEDPFVDAAHIYSQREQGFKSSVTAHDGSREGKNALKNHMFENLKIPGHYAETSGAWASVLDKEGMPSVTDYDHIRELVNKPISESDNGRYMRDIGGVEHEKQIHGTPMKEGADWTQDFLQQSLSAHNENKPFFLQDYNFQQEATQ
tara:strand:- start:24921 stop:27737 length:2817 start_codon:yes stop_codon:yes gene_type:complete